MAPLKKKNLEEVHGIIGGDLMNILAGLICF